MVFQKNLLRDSCSEYVEPQVMFDTKKRGFNATIKSIFNFNNKKLANYVLNKNSEIYEYVNFDEFKNLLSQKKYLNSESKFIFSVISTMIFIEKFYEKNLISNGVKSVFYRIQGLIYLYKIMGCVVFVH